MEGWTDQRTDERTIGRKNGPDTVSLKILNHATQNRREMGIGKTAGKTRTTGNENGLIKGITMAFLLPIKIR